MLIPHMGLGCLGAEYCAPEHGIGTILAGAKDDKDAAFRYKQSLANTSRPSRQVRADVNHIAQQLPQRVMQLKPEYIPGLSRSVIHQAKHDAANRASQYGPKIVEVQVAYEQAVQSLQASLSEYLTDPTKGSHQDIEKLKAHIPKINDEISPPFDAGKIENFMTRFTAIHMDRLNIDSKEKVEKYDNNPTSELQRQAVRGAFSKVGEKYTEHQSLSAQKTQAEADVNRLRTLGHITRGPSYAWALRMTSKEFRANCGSGINFIGVLGMVTSTPLIFVSMKQMFDTMREGNANNQQQAAPAAGPPTGYMNSQQLSTNPSLAA